MESRFVQSNGITLHCLEWGKHGTPVVMVHGTSLCALVWKPYAESLSRSYHVFALDQRGHGDSDKPGQYLWDDTGRDVAGFLDALDLRDAIVVGHSSGGMACLIGAALRPERVARAVLIEPTSVVSPRYTPSPNAPPDPSTHSALRRRRVWDGRRQMFASYRSRPPMNAWREDIVRAYLEGGTRDLPDGTVELKCHPEVEVQFYQNRTKLDPWPYVARFRCPTLLVLGGTGGAFSPQSALKHFLGLVPWAKMVTIPGTGHFAPMEKPDEVQASIWDFLGRP